MSYSFSIRGATKDAAKYAVEKAFDEVVANQPIHARDRAAAIANASAAIDLLGEDASKQISVSCNGYVSWLENGDLTGASIASSASLVAPL
jgi:hypothetical protein